MSSNICAITDRDTVLAAVARFEAAQAALAAVSFEALAPTEILDVADRLETVARRQPVVEYAALHHLTSQACPTELGATSWKKVLSTRLRITQGEATTRLATAADLGPRRAMTGEPLEPVLPDVAAAQARGLLGAEHVKVIRKFFRHLPVSVGFEERVRAQESLADVASRFDPNGVQGAADLLMALLHPDGDFSDADRARQRSLTWGKQGPDGMSTLTATATPEFRATWEPILAKYAAPGMCNPADEQPCVDDQPTQAQIVADHRTAGQRQHDGFIAAGRAVLASGKLGKLNGLPATIIVSVSLHELLAGAGYAVTAGGTRLSIRDVIRLASHSYHYLAVFNRHREQALYLAKAQRLATPGQRIVLHARDRGCTTPGCTVPGYWAQVHHISGWKNTHQTNIDDLTFACGPDNRMVETTGWTTIRGTHGRTEWIPPPHLDSGQSRINHLHHPEDLLGHGEPDPDNLPPDNLPPDDGLGTGPTDSGPTAGPPDSGWVDPPDRSI